MHTLTQDSKTNASFYRKHAGKWLPSHFIHPMKIKPVITGVSVPKVMFSEWVINPVLHEYKDREWWHGSMQRDFGPCTSSANHLAARLADGVHVSGTDSVNPATTFSSVHKLVHRRVKGHFNVSLSHVWSCEHITPLTAPTAA
jgi:hypothetical protein